MGKKLEKKEMRVLSLDKFEILESKGSKLFKVTEYPIEVDNRFIFWNFVNENKLRGSNAEKYEIICYEHLDIKEIKNRYYYISKDRNRTLEQNEIDYLLLDKIRKTNVINIPKLLDYQLAKYPNKIERIFTLRAYFSDDKYFIFKEWHFKDKQTACNEWLIRKEREIKPYSYYNENEFYIVVNNLYDTYEKQFEFDFKNSPDKPTLLNSEIKRCQKLLGIIDFNFNEHTVKDDIHAVEVVIIEGIGILKKYAISVRDWYLNIVIKGYPPQTKIDDYDEARGQADAFAFKKYLDYLSNEKNKKLVQKDTKFWLNTLFDEQVQTTNGYKFYKREIENNGWLIVTTETDNVKIYTPELVLILFSKELPARNMDTQKETTVNGFEYLKTYIQAFKEGEKYFDTEFAISPNTLYGANAEQYVRDIHSNYFHKGVNKYKGWEYVKKHHLVILTHKAVKEFGFYSGIVSKVEAMVKKYPKLFQTFDKGTNAEQPEPEIKPIFKPEAIQTKKRGRPQSTEQDFSKYLIVDYQEKFALHLKQNFKDSTPKEIAYMVRALKEMSKITYPNNAEILRALNKLFGKNICSETNFNNHLNLRKPDLTDIKNRIEQIINNQEII